MARFNAVATLVAKAAWALAIDGKRNCNGGIVTGGSAFTQVGSLLS